VIINLIPKAFHKLSVQFQRLYPPVSHPNILKIWSLRFGEKEIILGSSIRRKECTGHVSSCGSKLV
jgi:hypothetical protein